MINQQMISKIFYYLSLKPYISVLRVQTTNHLTNMLYKDARTLALEKWSFEIPFCLGTQKEEVTKC